MVTEDRVEHLSGGELIQLTEAMLESGEIEVVRRLVDASNATLFGHLLNDEDIKSSFPSFINPLPGKGHSGIFQSELSRTAKSPPTD